MKKIIFGVVLVVVVLAALAYIFSQNDTGTNEQVTNESSEALSQTLAQKSATEIESMPASARELVEQGEYTIDISASVVSWAGKKPLQKGYINAGTLSLSGGSILVLEATATGEFVFDMNSLAVGNTPTKPGQESLLEGHLKSDRWFGVTEYPEATFTIDAVTPRADSEDTYIYDVEGTLEMKGESGPITFPALIYLDEDGTLRATASFEFDRTAWGITSGSGSFFDDLADNVIDDMVQISFDLVAEG